MILFKRIRTRHRANYAYKLAVQDCIATASSTRPKEPMVCSDWYDARDEIIAAMSQLKTKEPR